MARMVDALIESIRPTAYVYGPSVPRLDPETIAGGAGNERWSRDGQLAMYLGLSPAVVLAEWARHLDPDSAMTVWRLALRDVRVIDLRRPAVRDALALPRDPAWALDRGRTQAAADMIRGGLPVDGLIVPSVAFLDRPEEGNLVVSLSDPSQARELVRSSRPVGAWSWQADGDPSR
jgi:RES domain-containing protein